MVDMTIAVVERFNDGTNRHDVDDMMRNMTDDVVFESTSPRRPALPKDK